MSTSINTDSGENQNPEIPQSAKEGGLGFIKEKFWLYFILFSGIYMLGRAISRSANQALWTQSIRNTISATLLSILLAVGLFNGHILYLILLLYVPFSDALPGRFGGGHVALNLFNLLSILVILTWIIDKFKKDRPLLVINRQTKIALMFIVLSILSYAINGYEYGGPYLTYQLFNLKRWIDPVLLFFITSGMTYRRDLRRDAVIAMMLGTAMVIFLAVKDVGEISRFSDERRIRGVGDQPNMLGAFVVDYMFVFLGVLMANFRKKIYWLATVPFWWGIRTVMFAFSRGAYLGFVASCLFISFIKNKLLFIMCVAIFLFISQNLWVLPPAVQERIEMTVQKDRLYDYGVEMDKSSKDRVEAWKYTLNLIKSKPLLGYGIGMVGTYLYFYERMTIGDVHNSYLLLAAEYGLITLAVFLASMFMGMRTSWFVYKHSKDDILKGAALGFLTGIVGLAVNCFFGSHMTTLWEIAYYWIFLAIFANEEKELRNAMAFAGR